ncbi:MAG: hypothetical protein B6D63_00460 [Candidatus Latescibacteria bacterium 4484_7]|nr:MAG: hypothetical protein B6D63_00460 [Candidatus Latescibacteria bacterium 4484_7]
MRRKKTEEKKGGAPGWMVTYGDLMSLLLTFFVLLVSMSSIQESKFKQALGSLLGALGVMNMDRSAIQFDRLPIPDKYKEELGRLRNQVRMFKNYIRIKGIESKVSIEETEEGMLIRLSGPLMFESGKADLNDYAKDILTHVVNVLKESDAQIRVEGHTDNIPISNSKYSSNWELSTARAISVLKFLNNNGIPGTRLSAVGYGEFRPIVPNDTAENRRRNRRVEIYVDYKDAIMKKAVQSIAKDKEEKNG